MYLVDTNLVLEVLLRQANAEEAKRFLEHAPSEQLFLTDYVPDFIVRLKAEPSSYLILRPRGTIRWRA